MRHLQNVLSHRSPGDTFLDLILRYEDMLYQELAPTAFLGLLVLTAPFQGHVDMLEQKINRLLAYCVLFRAPPGNPQLHFYLHVIAPVRQTIAYF